MKKNPLSRAPGLTRYRGHVLAPPLLLALAAPCPAQDAGGAAAEIEALKQPVLERQQRVSAMEQRMGYKPAITKTQPDDAPPASESLLGLDLPWLRSDAPRALPGGWQTVISATV